MNCEAFIDRHTEIMTPIDIANKLAWWNLAVTGEEKYAKTLQETSCTIRKLYASKSDYQFLLSHESSNPHYQRQRTLLLHSYMENQIDPSHIDEIVRLETEIEQAYTNFRPKIEENEISNNDLSEILKKSPDSNLRKEAWCASKRIGRQVEARVKQLIALRNRAAKEAGFSDFYSMKLTLQEIDQERLFALLHELEQRTTPLWNSYKKELDQQCADHCHIKPDELKPWHYQDPFFQEAPETGFDFDRFYKNKDIVEISRSFFEGVGLPVEDVLAHSDLYERKNKNQHAFCLCIDRQSDVRILCNLRDNDYWMATQLHELGHAVYDKYIDPTLPFLLRTPAHTSSTEAIAMLFGRLDKDGDFLHRIVGITEQLAAESAKIADRCLAGKLLVFARWALVMIHFERAMYQQPTIDLNTFWWDCVERFQGVKREMGRNEPDWAAKLHLACAPVYYQNYILGEMTTSQLAHAIKNKLAEKGENFVTSPLVGQWLIEKFFKYGSLYPWEETLRLATGEGLNPSYFEQDLSPIL